MVALCDVYVHDGAASSSSSRTQSCESEYLSAGSRLLSAACIPQPKLIVHYKAVNSSREQVFTLDISSARCWLRHNHLWANEMWMHWSELQSLMYLTFLSHETTSFFTRDVSGWKNNQWNQEKLNSLISVGSTFVTLMVIFRLTPELFKKANILFLFICFKMLRDFFPCCFLRSSFSCFVFHYCHSVFVWFGLLGNKVQHNFVELFDLVSKCK